MGRCRSRLVQVDEELMEELMEEVNEKMRRKVSVMRLKLDLGLMISMVLKLREMRIKNIPSGLWIGVFFFLGSWGIQKKELNSLSYLVDG